MEIEHATLIFMFYLSSTHAGNIFYPAHKYNVCKMSKNRFKKRDIYTLVTFAKNGNTEALEELIRRVQKNIFVMFTYLTSKRQDIADLTQEALVRMSKNITSLRNPANFKAWLNQIVTNIFYHYVKKHASDKEVEFNNDKLLEIKDKIGCEPGEKCLFAEMEKLIRAALLSLPDNLRIVIVLREYEGLSYEDIAKITNTALGTVKSRISRARIKLQQELKEFI